MNKNSLPNNFSILLPTYIFIFKCIGKPVKTFGVLDELKNRSVSSGTFFWEIGR